KLAAHHQFSFRLYGVHDRRRGEEYLAPLRQAGVKVDARPKERYPSFIASLGEVAIGLQPICASHAFSQGKSFGKVLAYLAADVAVIASDALDYPLFFRHGENGMLVRSVDDWVNACRFLLQNHADRSRMVAQARHDFLEQLTTAHAAEQVGQVL